MQGIDMSQIGEELFKALGYLIAGLVIWLAYNIGRDGTSGTENQWGVKVNKEHTVKEVMSRAIKGVLIIALIASFAGYSLGTATSCEDIAPRPTNCETETTSNPTMTDRLGQGAFIAVLLAVPYLLGITSKYQYIKSGKEEEDHKDNLARIDKRKKESDNAYEEHMKQLRKAKKDS